MDSKKEGISADLDRKVEHYRVMLSSFSYYLALIILIAERLERRELTGAEYLREALYYADYYKEEYLKARKELGLYGDDSALKAFKEPFSFLGFSVRDGRFFGDPEAVEKILDKNCNFKCKVPSEDEALRLEISTYAYMSAKGAKNLFVRYQTEETEKEKLIEEYCLKKGCDRGSGFLARIRALLHRFWGKIRIWQV